MEIVRSKRPAEQPGSLSARLKLGPNPEGTDQTLIYDTGRDADQRGLGGVQRGANSVNRACQMSLCSSDLHASHTAPDQIGSCSTGSCARNAAPFTA
jgi:hypothetical protein